MKKTTRFSLGLIFLFFIMIVINWIVRIKNGEMPRFDIWTRPYVATVAETKVYMLFRWITELGSFHFVFPLTVIGVILFWVIFRDYVPAAIFGLGVLCTHLLNQLIKELVARERPSISVLLNAEGYSFPDRKSVV